MESVKYYHVSDSGLVEGVALGRTTVVLVSDFSRVSAENEALQRLLNNRDDLDDPVPPAGGKPDPIIAVLKGHLADGMNPMFSGGDLKHLIGRLEAGTRLQAEVERLGSIGRGQRKTIDNVQLQVERLQSELTKARELLARVKETWSVPDPDDDDLACWDSIDEFLTNQSAPADKGAPEDCAHSEANKHGCPECGEEFKP